MNSLKPVWYFRSTGVPVSPPSPTPSSSSPATPPSWPWSPASPCALRPSASTLPSEGSPSGTWDRPLPSVSSSPPPPRRPLVLPPRLDRRYKQLIVIGIAAQGRHFFARTWIIRPERWTIISFSGLIIHDLKIYSLIKFHWISSVYGYIEGLMIYSCRPRRRSEMRSCGNICYWRVPSVLQPNPVPSPNPVAILISALFFSSTLRNMFTSIVKNFAG